MWPWPRPTCTPNFILIRPTVWTQYTNVTDMTDRQDNGPIAEGEPFYKRSPKNRRKLTFGKNCHARQAKFAARSRTRKSRSQSHGKPRLFRPSGLLFIAARYLITSGQSNLAKGRIAAAHGWYSLYFIMGRPFPSQNCSFPWGIWTSFNTRFFGPTRVHNQKSISIG